VKTITAGLLLTLGVLWIAKGIHQDSWIFSGIGGMLLGIYTLVSERPK